MCFRIQLPKHSHGITIYPAEKRADVCWENRRQHVVASIGEVDGGRPARCLNIAHAVGLDEVADVRDEDCNGPEACYITYGAG